MLNKIAELIKKRYKLILVVAVAFTALNIYWISQLKVNMQMMDMMPADEPTVMMYKQVLDNYKGIDAISLIVEGKEQDIKSYMEDVRGKILEIDKVDRVITRNETGFFRKHGLLLLKKRELNSLKNMLTASSMRDFIKGLNDNFEKEYIASEESDKISKDKMQMLSMFNTIEDMFTLLKDPNPDTLKIEQTSNAFLVGPDYYISPDRSMGLAFIHTSLSMTDIEAIVPLVVEVEDVVKAHQEKHNVSAGVSGFMVLQRDEMHATMKDMKLSSSLSLILILCIFLAGFRLFRYTILSLIPLIVGVIWAIGLTYITIGSLNAFTAMMGAILIGLGIDYAIHIIALFTEERKKGTSVEDAISQVFKKTVKGIITGSVTTAVGFSMFAISSFKGFSEFGITLGVGIISTVVASIFILPSLLMIFGRKDVTRAEKKGSPFLSLYNNVVLSKPWYIVVLFVILVVGSAANFNKIRFTTNIKDIEPLGLESLELNDRLIEKFDFSNDQTLGITKTIEEAHSLKEEAEDLDTVSFVESIANYIPLSEKQKERRELLRQFKKQVPPDVDKKLYKKSLAEEMLRLEDNIIELSDLSYMAGEHKIVDKADALINSKVISSLADAIDEHSGSISKVQKVFIRNLKDIVLGSNSVRDIEISDLPDTIREMYIGKDGSYLTVIYPDGDVWTNEFQPLFMAAIKSIKTPLTGTSLLSIDVMNTAGAEGKRILLIVVAMIYLILLIDFRSFKYATLAMIPMVLMFVLLMGLMVLFNIPFDYVNIIALPIIIGIGVDDGVHLIHRYRIEKKLLPTVASTGRGILLTSLTTMAAFGTMMISTYQGFGSFGKLLVFGIGLAYILTILLLGALLRITDNVVE